jgi:alpha-L-fucosidase 2
MRAAATLDVRNGWFDGNGMNSFYPAAVRVGYDPKVILAKLREMVTKHGAPNGFIKRNPHGIENCSTVPNTINEMLCMGHRGVLRLFPVWPRDTDARFAGLRAWGAFLVDSELRDGVVQYVRIKSERGRPCTVQNPWPRRKVTVFRAGVKAETVSGPRFTLKTRVDEELKLLPHTKP